MLLSEFLKRVGFENIVSIEKDINLTHVVMDSRSVSTETIFFAKSGTLLDGHAFIDQAIAKGAPVIVYDPKKYKPILNDKVVFLPAENPNQLLTQILSLVYPIDFGQISVVGITGTNGKTTLTYLLESIIQSHQSHCGVVGTINYRYANTVLDATNTTPSVTEIHRLIHDMQKNDIDYCVMEVSSHALDQGRVEGIEFGTSIFTNLTSDHLDYHQTRENYFSAKSKLFQNLSTEADAVLNADDPYSQRLRTLTSGKIITYGIQNKADISVLNMDISLKSTLLKIRTPNGNINLQSQLIGRFNVYNILAAVAFGYAENFTLSEIKNGIEKLSTIPGRMEKIDLKQEFSVFIDYAHTDDALRNVLQTIREASDEKLILVFGCGGDRDRTKRPEMAKTASQYADFTIITSDNPRTENPESIINEITSAMTTDAYAVNVNRESAIKQALLLARPKDIVLIAGKGHENYQIVQDGAIKFDEREIIKTCLLK
ncbi:MAG: UDP-N-acetylmuramoyl-L-alanyl-D-glutamate--2,6-diaminopimelate ligase [Candidatus Omnitrophica bacterium]|nr:UDP-N-acetylmuramoyl-L-alanyl-D-glutamate--2,6-diaminopimelate ligase [Candidatus Omnitrophota bacterium]